MIFKFKYETNNAPTLDVFRIILYYCLKSHYVGVAWPMQLRWLCLNPWWPVVSSVRREEVTTTPSPSTNCSKSTSLNHKYTQICSWSCKKQKITLTSMKLIKLFGFVSFDIYYIIIIYSVKISWTLTSVYHVYFQLERVFIVFKIYRRDL